MQERFLYTGFPRSLTDGYAILMSPSKGETAVHDFHCSRDMAGCAQSNEVQSIFHQLLYFMTFLHKFKSERVQVKSLLAGT